LTRAVEGKEKKKRQDRSNGQKEERKEEGSVKKVGFRDDHNCIEPGQLSEVCIGVRGRGRNHWGGGVALKTGKLWFASLISKAKTTVP